VDSPGDRAALPAAGVRRDFRGVIGPAPLTGGAGLRFGRALVFCGAPARLLPRRVCRGAFRRDFRGVRRARAF